MKIKAVILRLLFFVVEKTCFWKHHNKHVLEAAQQSGSPTLICMWHGHFIFPMIYLKNNLSDISVISSTHRDSMVLASVLQKYKFNLIKGSSTRGAKNVLKNMIKKYKKSESVIAITNDGPKGPARIAKAGALQLAHKMGANILFMTGRSSRFWKLKTWDRFVLPKPFATNHVYFAKIDIPKEIDKNLIGEFITSWMNKLENDIDKNNL